MVVFSKEIGAWIFSGWLRFRA